MKTTLWAVPALCLTMMSACVVREVRPAARPMSQEEAVRRGYNFCADHGFSCQAREVFLDGNIWRVNFHAENARRNGRLHLDYDAYNRNLLRAEEPPVLAPAPVVVARPPPPPPPPTQARGLSSDDAVREGNGYCRDHGFACRLLDVNLNSLASAWHVNYEASRPGMAGRLHIELDRNNGAILRVDEPRGAVVAGPPPPGGAGPGPGPMNSEEARRRGQEFCHSRGFECRLLDEDFRDGRLWKLNFEVMRGGRGRIHIVFDAYNRQRVDLREDVHG